MEEWDQWVADNRGLETMRPPQRLGADRSHLPPQVHRRYEQPGGCHIQVQYGARERAHETGRHRHHSLAMSASVSIGICYN
jgi:hypothetical protein